MIKIRRNTILKINDHLLWENSNERAERFGKFSVVVIVRHGSMVGHDFYLNIPGTDRVQYMDLDTLRRNSKLLEIDKEPEYFL